MQDTINLYFMGYLIGLWNIKPNRKKLLTFFVAVVVIIFLPAAKMIDKTLLIELLLVLVLSEGRMFQRIACCVQMQILIVILDSIFTNMILFFSDMWNVDIAHKSIVFMGSFLRFVFILLIGFFLQEKREKIVKMVQSISVKLAVYIIVSMAITLIAVVFAEMYLLDYNIERLRNIISVFIFLCGILQLGVCGLVEYMFYEKVQLKELNQLKENLIEMQKQSYAEINRKNNDLRKFRHDYNQHILTLVSLCQKKDIQGTEQYIMQLGQKKMEMYYISTGNSIADVVLNQMYELAKQKHIEFQYEGKFTKLLNEKPEMALASVLYNALNNAIEATERYTGEDKRVYMKVDENASKNFDLIFVSNSANAPQMQNNNLISSKSDHKNHGIGMRNIKQAMEECNGIMDWTYHENQFELMLYFYSS